MHAVDRALERYGLIPTPSEWRQALIDIIDAAERIPPARALLLRNDGAKEHWACQLGARAVVAVYDPQTACIVSLVPIARELVERHGQTRNQRHHVPRRRDKAERYQPEWED